MRMFIQFIIIIFTIQLLWFCKSSTESENISGLEEIYQLNSQQGLEQYLSAWESEIQPIDNEEFNQLSDTLKTLYRIYQEFYNPTDLSRYCTAGRCPEFGNQLYESLDYFIVQTEIKYTLNEYEDHKTVYDFRPDIDLDNPILYLSNDYEEELASFLDREEHELDIQNRYDFLNTMLGIWPGHWFGWHFLTHPEVDMIYFNQYLDSARVHFRIIFEGGEARFAKMNNNWEMIESQLTWIE